MVRQSCCTSSCSFLTQLPPELLRLAPNITNVSTMPLRLFTMALRLAKNTSIMPPDWTKSSRLPIALNMSKTVGRFQELSRTTTIAVGCHHGYSSITPMSKIVVIWEKSGHLTADLSTNRDSVTGPLECMSCDVLCYKDQCTLCYNDQYTLCYNVQCTL
jgi:hypothetical protein